ICCRRWSASCRVTAARRRCRHCVTPYPAPCRIYKPRRTDLKSGETAQNNNNDKTACALRADHRSRSFMSGDNSLIRLKLPEQDLHALTLGSDQPRKLQVWVDHFPLMNMGETSRQLYQYLQELNRLPVDTRTRMQLLEIVRPAVLHVCDSLGKHYLKQSLVLPEKARRVASLAQALQGHLASGYKLVVARGVARIQRMQQDGERERPQDREIRLAIATALERAVAALGDTLLRCYQLYFPTPRHLWLELHQLYLLASTCQLALLPVPDPALRRLPAITVAQAYCRTLLLATAKPNQLRQQELAWIYDATEAWSVLMAVRPAASRDDLFVFDLLL